MSEIVVNNITPAKGLSTRTVRVSEEHSKNVGIIVLFAAMNESNICITRMKNDLKPRSLGLSAEEMDSLAGDWLAFRAAVRAIQDAEKLRLFDVQFSINKILVEVPEIEAKNKQETNEYFEGWQWRVRIEKIGFMLYANDLDEVLEAVKSAQSKLQEHHDYMAQVKSIVAQHPEIQLKQQSHPGTKQKTWIVSVPSANWQSRRADSAMELLQYVQEAVAKLEAATPTTTTAE